MKQFTIDVDFTMSKRITVEAENEERAKAIINGWIKYNPYEYAHSFDAYVKHEITDVNEEDPDDVLDYSPTMREAVKYAMKQMEEEDVAIIAAKVSKNFNQHMNPAYGIDDGKIIDLLEEYGQDNDLPEGWWESECEMDDIVLLIAHWS